jgi:hypothetical protein
MIAGSDVDMFIVPQRENRELASEKSYGKNKKGCLPDWVKYLCRYLLCKGFAFLFIGVHELPGATLLIENIHA